MRVSIKSFSIDMEVKSKGIELEIRDPKGKFLGDLFITNTKLIWCPGKTSRENGQAITWPKFQTYMNSL